MFNIISEINPDMLAGSLSVVIILTVLTALVALVAVFLIGKYHAVQNDDTLMVGRLKIGYVIGIVAVVGVAVRLLLTFVINGYADSYSSAYGVANDVVNINEGFEGFTGDHVNVAPLAGYIYALFGGWGLALGFGQDDIMMQFFLKLPLILADVATFAILYRIANKYANRYVSLALASQFMLSPMFFVMSSAWGSVYSLLLPAVLLTFYFLLNKNIFGMTVAVCAACLVSPDAIFIAPIVAIYLVYAFVKAIMRMVKVKPSFDAVFRDGTLYNVFYVPLCIVLGIAAIYLISLPAYYPDGVIGFADVYSQLFIRPFTYADGVLEYFAANGLNIFTIFTLNFTTLGTNFPTLFFVGIFLVLIVALVLVIFLMKRNRANIVLLASFVSLTVAVYFIGTGEWATAPALLLMLFCFAVAKDKRILKVFSLQSVFVTLNALLVMLGGNQISGTFNEEVFQMSSDTVFNTFSILLSVLSVLTHIYYTVVVMDITLTKRRKEFLTESMSSFGEVMHGWIRG